MVNGDFVSKSTLWPCPGVLVWVKNDHLGVRGIKRQIDVLLDQLIRRDLQRARSREAQVHWRRSKYNRTRTLSPMMSPSERKAKYGIKISSRTRIVAILWSRMPPPISDNESMIVRPCRYPTVISSMIVRTVTNTTKVIDL